MRKCVRTTCILIGFLALATRVARADDEPTHPTHDDFLTPSKALSGDHGTLDDRGGEDHPPVPARDRKYGVGDVDIYTRYAHAARGASANGLTQLGTVGLDVHGLYGKQVGYAFGLGFDLGLGIDQSFAYGARISPLGWGLALGPSGYMMLIGGIGFDGVSARVPLSGIFPVQLVAAYDVTARVRIGFDAGLTWAANSDRISARNLAVGDELDLGTSLRIGTGPCGCGDFHMGRGYFFRLDRKEQMNTTFFGISVGLEIDGAG